MRTHCRSRSHTHTHSIQDIAPHIGAPIDQPIEMMLISFDLIINWLVGCYYIFLRSWSEHVLVSISFSWSLLPVIICFVTVVARIMWCGAIFCHTHLILFQWIVIVCRFPFNFTIDCLFCSCLSAFHCISISMIAFILFQRSISHPLYHVKWMDSKVYIQFSIDIFQKSNHKNELSKSKCHHFFISKFRRIVTFSRICSLSLWRKINFLRNVDSTQIHTQIIRNRFHFTSLKQYVIEILKFPLFNSYFRCWKTIPIENLSCVLHILLKLFFVLLLIRIRILFDTVARFIDWLIVVCAKDFLRM